MLELPDPPLGLRDGGGLLADDFVAEVQIGGQGGASDWLMPPL
jgi:hypothetical protein